MSPDTSISVFYIAVFVPATELVPLGIAFYKYKALPRELKPVAWYLLLNTISCIITSGFSFSGINNMPVMHGYTVAEYLLLAMFFYRACRGARLRRYVLPVSLLFTAFCIANVFTWQPIHSYNSYSKSAEALLIMIFSVSCFTSTMNEETATATGRTFGYINAGLLLYFSASFILFLLYGLEISFVKTYILIWDIHATFLLLMFTMFTIGLWRYKT